MTADDRRRGARIRCATSGTLEAEGQAASVLVTELSAAGVRISGRTLPAVGAPFVLRVAAPRGELEVRGQVRWVDPALAVAGAALDRVAGEVGRALRDALLALAYEVECDRPAVALLLDDPEVAARWCAPLRAHGFVPRVFRTHAEAVAALAAGSPRVAVAVVGGAALGATGPAWLDRLAEGHPTVRRILVADQVPASSPAVHAVVPAGSPVAAITSALVHARDALFPTRRVREPGARHDEPARRRTRGGS